MGDMIFPDQFNPEERRWEPEYSRTNYLPPPSPPPPVCCPEPEEKRGKGQPAVDPWTRGRERGRGQPASGASWMRGRGGEMGGRGVTSQVERREGEPHQPQQGLQSGERTYKQQKGYTC